VRIIDFGIALVADSEVSHIEGIAGSPSYMSPEQVQGLELNNRSDLYSLGAVMYELLTGARLFRASNLGKLMSQIIYATPAPIHTKRPGVPEELEQMVAVALQKDPDKRYLNGGDFAAALMRVHRKLSAQSESADTTGQFAQARNLKFFRDFSQAEIREVLKASVWQNYVSGEEIVKEGDLDERFYIVMSGGCVVERGGKAVGRLESGDCFGESSYLPGVRRSATVRAVGEATLLKVSATLLEQASPASQLRFNQVFLRRLIDRLQKSEDAEAR
jgi:serine/threonine protein kinase